MPKTIIRLWHLVHGCPCPPPILEAIIGSIGGISIWEQRMCTCGKRTHWRRDYPGESFKLWTNCADNFLLPQNGGEPINADLRNYGQAEGQQK